MHSKNNKITSFFQKNSIAKFLTQKQAKLFAYKILNDIAFLIMLVFTGILVSEGILPGFLSSRLSFTKLILLLIPVLTIIAYLGKVLELSYPKISIRKKKFVPFFLTVAMILLGNSMLKFALWQNLIIILSAVILLFLFYRIIFFSRIN